MSEDIIIYKCGHILAINNISIGKYLEGRRVATDCPVCKARERFSHGLP